MITKAVVLDYNKKHVWVRLPEVRKHTIFTMPREWLAYGYAQYRTLRVDYDPESVEFDGFHFVADMEILDGIRKLGGGDTS